MPVQINEMIIRANILEEDQHDGHRHEGHRAPAPHAEGFNKEEIIKECAALVMEIINNKNQR